MDTKKKVLVLGATGMLGSMVYAVFNNQPNYIVATTYHNAPLSKYLNKFIQYQYLFSVTNDIELNSKTFELLKTVEPDYIINCIGYITSDNEANAMLINATFPHILSQQSYNLNPAIKIIHISTDGIFDGTSGQYTEHATDFCNTIYAKTKRLGEVYNQNVLNFRCSIFGFDIVKQKSLLNWLLQQPINAVVNGFDNYYWNGVSTLQYAQYCLFLIENNLFTTYRQQSHCLHLVLNETVSKYQMLLIFKTIFNRNDIVVKNVLANKKIDRTLKSMYLLEQNNSFLSVVDAFKQFIISSPVYTNKLAIV